MNAPRESSVSKEQLRRLTSEAVEAATARQRRVDASPKREDFEREFGKDKVKDEKDGSWTLTLHERDDIKKAHQMQEGARQLEIERGEQLKAKSDGRRERLVRQDGRVIELQEELVEQAKKRLRPAGRNGGAPSLKFGLSDSFGRYKQGPEGLWFVWNDGWEPTSLWSEQAKGDEQHDPDGNLWVRAGEGWELADEVS